MIFELQTVYNALKDACDSWNAANPALPPRTVIPTRWVAEKGTSAPPAFIIDVNGPEDGELLESGRELPAGNFFYFEAAVAHEDDPLDTWSNLASLVQFAEDTLSAAIPAALHFMQKETSDVPFGKTTTLSFMATMYIGYFTADDV